jgi:hypothetical protein
MILLSSIMCSAMGSSVIGLKTVKTGQIRQNRSGYVGKSQNTRE